MTKFIYKINERGNATVSLTAYREIGDEGFNPSIDDRIILPNSINGIVVDAIAEDGLSICEEAMSIYIPSTIKFIGKNAFKRCINAIVYFEADRFDYTIDIHDGDAPTAYFGITFNNLFTDKNFDYILEDNKVTISRYNGWELNVAIPSNVILNGIKYDVFKIGNSCFDNSNSYDIETICVPNSIKIIENNAFDRCENAIIKLM